MKLFRSTILFIFIILSIQFVNAQHNVCGTDAYMAEILKTNPELLKSITEYNTAIGSLNDDQQKSYKKGATRTIPVVFHVIHNYGDENITKAQIEDQLRILNEDFQRLNKDTSATRAAFKSIAGDFDIEFKLARKDPSGNCTEGITRTASYLTDGGDEAVKGLVRWPYRTYLNIWVVKYISLDVEGTGKVLGYSRFPNSTNSGTDGIVILADYVGSNGTATGNGNYGRTLTHEIGHWLGLFHPFQNSCGGGNCSNSGDYVCDTPPVSDPSFGCPKTNNTCSNESPNQLDMVENFMDYAYGSCQNMFTKGQKAVADYNLGRTDMRGQNISTTAHTTSGIFTNPTCGPIADFNTSNNVVTVCEGGALTFKDYSYNGTVSTYLWTFDGGSPGTSAASAPTVTYSAAGLYKVTLKATNAQGNNTKVWDKMIRVFPSVSANKTPVIESFESPTVLTSPWLGDMQGDYGWKRTTTEYYSGGASVVAIIDAGTLNNALFNLITPAFDISPLKGRQPKLKFHVAYRPGIEGNSEILTVFATTDCGKTWKPLKAYSSATGLGVDKVVSSGWAPVALTDWKELTLDLANYENNTNLILKFEARSRSGNSIYLDNVNIVAELASNPKPLNPDDMAISVYPNPSIGSVNIDVETDGKEFGGIVIFNATGQEIINTENSVKRNGTEVNYTINHIEPGIYFAQIKIEGQLIVKKFIVIP